MGAIHSRLPGCTPSSTRDMRRMHKLQLANALIVTGALAPGAAALGFSRMLSEGGLSITPENVVWLFLVLGFPLLALVAGIAVAAPLQVTNPEFRTTWNLFLLAAGSGFALMLFLVLGMIWSRMP